MPHRRVARGFRRRKWRWIGAYWLLQSAVVYLLGFIPFPFDEYHEVITDPDWILAALIISGALIVLQALALVPICPRPAQRESRPFSLWISTSILGLLIGLAIGTLVLFAADVLWLAGVLDGVDREYGGFSDDAAAGTFWIAVAVLLLSWLVAAILIHAFVTRSPERIRSLSRAARLLFAGTIIEGLALMPLALLVRSRSGCLCAQGSAWGMSILLGVALCAFGPAVVFTLLAERPGHRRRYCLVCQYSLRGLVKPVRCPECGTPAA